MADTTTLVLFGASGDLARRKLVPALYRLQCKGRLPDDFRLLGVGRTVFSDTEFRNGLLQADQETAFDPAQWDRFAARLTYHVGDPASEEVLTALDARLRAIEANSGGRANRLYYLATPPQVYGAIIRGLGQDHRADERDGWRRVVVEKPFGSDLASARELNQIIHGALAEEQVYRIDHYLGKETVQNVLVFRFANSIFEPVWNRNYIDHVQITVAEEVGVEHRAQFYDSVGILRDMFQNHLMQLLALMAMEPPASFVADALRNERVKVLNAIRPMQPSEVERHTVRGQYAGYQDEKGVRPGSRAATYGAVRLYVDNWRWQGVPFYLRSGKKLARKSTEIYIQFKSVPHVMFPLPPGQSIRPNALALCLQPDEGIHLRFEAKVPDTVASMRSVDMDFHYAEDFGPGALPEAYERLLLDALNGDASLFTRADSIELAWGLIDPIVQAWEASQAAPPEPYPPGSWGPPAAEAFLAADGRCWTLGCGMHT